MEKQTAPSGVQEQSPWSGDQGLYLGAKPPEADDILTFETPTLALFFTVFYRFSYSTVTYKQLQTGIIMRAEDKKGNFNVVIT